MSTTPQPGAQFWLMTGDRRAGPFTVRQVHAEIAAGRATWQTPACPVGGAEWQPLLQTPGVGPAARLSGAKVGSPPAGQSTTAPAATALVDTTRTLPSPASASTPRLWNPYGAWAWSFLFTWAFGAFLVALNWKTLGEPGREKRSFLWLYAAVAFLGVVWLLPDFWLLKWMVRLGGFAAVVVWGLREAVEQADWVKERFGAGYATREWKRPIGVAAACLVFVISINAVSGGRRKDGVPSGATADGVIADEGLARDGGGVPAARPADGRASAVHDDGRPDRHRRHANGANAGDPAVGAVIGPTSDAYAERGYKGVILGTPFDELAREKGLKFHRVSQPWTITADSRGDEEFVFDAERRLVCYTRTYAGGADDYAEQLVALFGKAQRQPYESLGVTPSSAARRVSFDYTFPHVLGRVVFRTTAAEGMMPGQTSVGSETHVAVIDRAWATRLLDEGAEGRRDAVRWTREVAEKCRAGEISPAVLPPLPGAERREFPKESAPVRYYDLQQETEGGGPDTRRPSKAIVASVTGGQPGRRATPARVHFSFGDYSPLATEKVYRQGESQKAEFPRVLGARRVGNHALSYTPFSNLVTELNVAIAQEVFSPKSPGVDYVRPRSGSSYYEWKTADGWQVRCGFDDTLTVEWVGAKGL